LGTFEASLGGERWFVDGGLSGYGDDAARRYCRSSIAHNVATLDGRNQFDIWSMFRVGRRAHPVERQVGHSPECSWQSTAHRAYAGLGGGVLRRVTAAFADGAWACIDRCEGAVAGAGRLTGRLRLAPGVTARRVSAHAWELSCGARRRCLTFSEGTHSAAIAGWYFPRFGECQSIEVIEYTVSGAHPASDAHRASDAATNASSPTQWVGWTLTAQGAGLDASTPWNRLPPHAVPHSPFVP
jgi:hypothetical protein